MQTGTLSTLFTIEAPTRLFPPTPFRCKTKLGEFRLRLHDADPGVTIIGVHFASGSAIFTHGTAEDTIEFFPLDHDVERGPSAQTPWSLSDTTEVCELGMRLAMFVSNRTEMLAQVARDAARAARAGEARICFPGPARLLTIPRKLITRAVADPLGLPDVVESVIVEAILLGMAGGEFTTPPEDAK